MKIKKKKSGVTLVEVLISMAIFVIIAIPIGDMVVTSVKINASAQEKQQVTYITQRSLEQVKVLEKQTKDEIYDYMTSTMGMDSIGSDKVKGTLYYKSDGTIGDSNNHNYKIDVTLEEEVHDASIVNDITTNGIDIKDYDKLDYLNNIDKSISLREIKIKLASTKSNGIVTKYTSTIDTGDGNPIDTEFENINLKNALNFSINFKQDFSDTTKKLRVLVENSTDDTLNIYVNKPSSINAQYTIVNKNNGNFGRINQFFNYNVKGSYADIKKSVKITMTAYKLIDKSVTPVKYSSQIAYVEGYKNLD